MNSSISPLHSWQMVLNKVFFFFYNNFIIGFRGRSRFKQAALLHRVANSMLPLTHNDCVALLSPENALQGETCCVCLSSMGRDKEEGIETSILPCLHEFHKVCVDRWFEECRRTCPICRYSMEGGVRGGGGGSHENESTNHDQILTDEMVIWFSSFHTSGFWALFCFVHLTKSLFQALHMLPFERSQL